VIAKFRFPKWTLVTPVKVYQVELSEDAGPVDAPLYDGLCSYTEKTKQTLDKERKLVTLSGKIIIEGDINPGVVIQGYIEVYGVKKDIFRTSRLRNPDGSVFSTVLELI
jgi:hypothetical protein